MKSAPSLMAALTAIATLGAGALLASEDRMLFEPRHATVVVLADEVSAVWNQALWPDPPAPLSTRAGSDMVEQR